MSEKYLIVADKAARQDMRDGAPIESYYGYDLPATIDGAEFSGTKAEAEAKAEEFRRVWAEQDHDVHYTVEAID